MRLVRERKIMGKCGPEGQIEMIAIDYHPGLPSKEHNRYTYGKDGKALAKATGLRLLWYRMEVECRCECSGIFVSSLRVSPYRLDVGYKIVGRNGLIELLVALQSILSPQHSRKFWPSQCIGFKWTFLRILVHSGCETS